MLFTEVIATDIKRNPKKTTTKLPDVIIHNNAAAVYTQSFPR